MINNSSPKQTGLGLSQNIATEVGIRLRCAREAAGKTTLMISSKVKIREIYIVAIERGLWSELPPGLNGRGLIRIYAKELLIQVPELDPKNSQNAQSTPKIVSEPSPPAPILTDAPILPAAALFDANSFPEHKKPDSNQNNDVITPNVENVLGISLDRPSAQWENEPDTVPMRSRTSEANLSAAESQPVSNIFKNKNEQKPTFDSEEFQNSSAVLTPNKNKFKKILLFTFAAAGLLTVAAASHFFSEEKSESSSQVRENPSPSTSAAEVTPVPEKAQEQNSTEPHDQPALAARLALPAEAEKKESESKQTSATATTSPTEPTALSTPIASTTPAPPTATGQAKKAKLSVLSDVEIQVVADGIKVFSGIKSTGDFEVEFKKQAEILVQDGSKVSMFYENWNHGVLGHEKRKRRIVLNADPYVPKIGE